MSIARHLVAAAAGRRPLPLANLASGVARRGGVTMNSRAYSDKPTGEFSTPEAAGAGAKPGFARKEKAQEDSYFAKQEAEKMKKLRESIKVQKQHLEQLEKDIDDLHKK